MTSTINVGIRATQHSMSEIEKSACLKQGALPQAKKCCFQASQNYLSSQFALYVDCQRASHSDFNIFVGIYSKVERRMAPQLVKGKVLKKGKRAASEKQTPGLSNVGHATRSRVVGSNSSSAFTDFLI